MKTTPRSAMRFVLLLGVVSLFADMTYEAARSITGPYLAILGASATAVGVIAGLGELVGYGLRIVSGVISDRTHRYWTVTILGYVVNLLAVPALALAGRWEIAAVLIMAERFGKAIRTPARDAMLSHAAQDLGPGWVFGIHEAMDQIGAMAGPLIVAGVLAARGSYSVGFAVLLIPAVLALAVLAVARAAYPRPHALEQGVHLVAPGVVGLPFWLYLAAVACIAVGFVDFSLVAFHMKTANIFDDKWIPLVYSGAMGVDALSALILGRLYDRKGLPILMISVAISAWSAPLIFLSGPILLLLGMLLWGIGMGALESIVRAVVASIVPSDRRATGYGIFNAGFGLAWFAGSAVMGFLYDSSIISLAVFSVAFQAASLPIVYTVNRRTLRTSDCGGN